MTSLTKLSILASVFLFVSVINPVLANNVGNWTLDENTGSTASDASIYAQTGDLLNLPPTSWQEGISGSGLCFDGLSGQQVSIPNPGASLTPASVTVSSWVKVDSSLNGWAWVAGHGDNYGLFVNRNNDDGVTFYFYNGSTWRGITYANAGIKDGQWHHVAGSFNQDTGILAVYIDGVLLNSAYYPETIGYAIGTDFSIGSMQGQRNFKGCIDEVQVYDRALTEQDIQALAVASTQPPQNQSPVVNAGVDQTLQLPNDTTGFNVQITDDELPAGSALTYEWSQISGPGTATITAGALVDGNLPVTVTFDEPGIYVLRFSANDGQLPAYDDVQVTFYDESGVINPVLLNNVGNWTLDENTGSTASDASIYAQTGDLLNLPPTSWQEGISGSGLCFDGLSGQQVSIPNPGASLTPASVTVSSWVKVDSSLNGWAWVAGHGDNYGLYVNRNNDDGVTFYFYNGSTWRGITYANAGIKDGQWHHVAGSFNQDTGILAVYIDGVLLNSAYYPETIGYAIGTDFSIGSMQGQRNFKGCIDEVQVYDRALTEQDIQALAVASTQPPQNQSPVVNAGVDQTLQLPNDTTGFNVQITDDELPAGSALTYEWSQISGPGTATITAGALVDGNLPVTVTFDEPGIYVLRFSANDGQLPAQDDVQVTLFEEEVPVNSAPVVNAGVDQTLQLPNDTTGFNVQITDDELPAGSALTYEWSQISGPGTATITAGALVDGNLPVTVTFDEPGIYVLRFSANDGQLPAYDDVQVTFYDESGAIPVSANNVGNWTLDENTGSIASDASIYAQTGDLLNLPPTSWQEGISGSGLCFDGLSGQQVSIPNPGASLTPASVTVSSWVKVDSSLNGWAWVAGHGDNYGLFVNRNNDDGVTFYFYNGSTWRGITYANAGIKDGQWHHVAGSFNQDTGILAVYIDGVLLNSAYYPETIGYAIGTDFSIGSMQGQRNFKGCIDEVQVYDRALTEQDIQALAVASTQPPQNQSPVVNAGVDQTLQLPNDTTGFNVQITDDELPAGSALTYEWSQISGPGTATITAGALVDGNLPVTVTFDEPGIYVLRFSANDGQLPAQDDVQVTLFEEEVPVNSAPVVNAGVDQTLQLPNDTTGFNVQITDDELPAGSALTYEWSQISGPGTATITAGALVDGNLPVTVTFDEPGIYVLRFSANDGQLPAYDDVQVILYDDSLPLKVLTLGDSITHGIYGQTSYRRNLWFQLLNSNYFIDYVGTQFGFQHAVDPSFYDFDLDHEGHSGSEAGEVNDVINVWLQNYDADIALIHLGTNDLSRGQSIGSTLDEIEGIITKLRADNPSIMIFLAQIIPMQDYDTAAFNIQLETWAQGQVDPLSKLVIVDHYSGYDPFVDNFDRVHPNDSGEAKMANSWFQAFQENIQPGNQKPLVNAGADQTLQLPNDTTGINVQITDDELPAGSALTYEWSQISGPGTATITAGALVDGNLPVTVTFDQPGIYVLRFSANDGELSAHDDVKVIFYDESGAIPVSANNVGNWTLDENTGSTASDASIYAQTGDLLNLPPTSWQEGISGSGLCFDGLSGQQVSIPNPGASLTPASVTVSSWVKVDSSLNGWAWVAGHGDNYGLYVNRNNDDGVTFYFYNGSTWRGITYANAGIKDGQWHHVAGSFNQDTGILAVYVDGILLNSAYYPEAIAYAIGTDFSIGSMQGQRNFKGCIDEVQVYDRALTEQDIQTLDSIY